MSIIINSNSGGVSQIVAGSGITLSPVDGTGVVTVTSTGGSGGSGGIHSMLLGGGSLFGGVETSNLVSSANLSTYTCQPNQMLYFPYVPNNTFTSTTLAFNVTSSATNAKCKLYIYSHNGINAPKDRLYESTEVDLSTTGSKTLNVTYQFTKGTVYWFGIYSNIFGPNISGMNTQGGALPVAFVGTTQVLGWVQVSLTYPTAPTLAAPNSFSSSCALIRIK